ncbi:MAG: ComEC/Rec2 family competence protein [Akkermansia sp.]|nr:ComEC/Rec2 family competence protein [Akkermansia sp.]
MDVHPLDSLSMALRRWFIGAPLLLPLVGVVGYLLGGQWCCLMLAAMVVPHLLRLRRIFFCVLLCVGIAWVHESLQQRNNDWLREQLEAQGNLVLVGDVERKLSKGCILDTGFNGVRVVLRGDTPWRTGDRVMVTVVEQNTNHLGVEGMFDNEAWMASQGLAANLRVLRGEYLGRSCSWHTVMGFAESVRQHLTRALMPAGTEDDPRRQVLCALALGDKSLAEQDTLNVFKRGGCLHAFAVSGLHVGIVAGFLYALAYIFRLRSRTRSVLVLTVVGAYVLVTGLAVPAMRAYFMIALAVLGLELRRRVSLLNIWSFAALSLLLVCPWQLKNAGFVLSFAVYAGIALGVRCCMKESPWFAPDAYLPVRLYSRWQMYVCRMDYALRGCIVVSLSAWLVSLPITLAFFHTITPYSYLTNIAITPILPWVMGLGLLASVLGWVPYLGAGIQWCALQGSTLLIGVTNFFGGLPWSYIPAVAPQPEQAAMVCDLGYGETMTVLGNPGVVIGCGSTGTARFSSEPALFFSGYSPAAVLTTKQDSGSAVLKKTWPHIRLISTQKMAKSMSLSTAAGEFTVFPPPQGISKSVRNNTQPVVLWKKEKHAVLYIGNADALTVEALPESVWEGVSVVILGYNVDLPVDVAPLMRKLNGGKCILLPHAPQPTLQDRQADVELLRVGEEKAVLNFTLHPSGN